MMRAILIALVLATSYVNVNSQACCCSTASTNYSILPNIDNHVVGIRYSYSSYDATAYPVMNMIMNGEQMTMMGPGQAAVERMNTLEVFGRIKLPRRFQLSVFLPVHIMSESYTGSFQRSAGIGDASVLLQYAVFDPKKCTGKPIKHQLKFGFGVKAPTGQFKMNSDGLTSTDLEMGTGSVDFLMSAIYTLSYKKFGVNVVSAYKKDLVNSQHLWYGDKLKEGLNAFYILGPRKGISVTPTAGINYDHVFYNVYQKQTLNYTGGDYISASAGFDVFYKHFAFSTSISPMLMSILNWSGEPIQRFTFETGVYYKF
jgi:hypothetical protein